MGNNMMNRDSHRFRVQNTWCVDTSRQPNWVLSDLETGKEYRYFLLVEAEEQIEKLSDCILADTGPRKSARCRQED